jgi:hypothetical protein
MGCDFRRRKVAAESRVLLNLTLGQKSGETGNQGTGQTVRSSSSSYPKAWALPSSSKAWKKKNFLDDLSNSVRPFDYIVKAGQPARPKTKELKTITGEEEVMPQYLVANYLPDDFDPSTVTEEMMEEIHALNRELIAAGARKFACGISPAANAKTVRKQSDGKVLVTDGPYIETKEHMGGFWILEAANMDEALAWATKAAIACDVAGEVRELLFYPAPEPGENK